MLENVFRSKQNIMMVSISCFSRFRVQVYIISTLLSCNCHSIRFQPHGCSRWNVLENVFGPKHNMMVTLLIFLQNHDSRVAETAAVGYPHELYGEGMSKLAR